MLNPINTYEYEFDNTRLNVIIFNEYFQEHGFNFPTTGRTFGSTSFYYIPEGDKNTFVEVNCDSPVDEGKKRVRVQTDHPKSGDKRFNLGLQSVLNQIGATDLTK